MAFVAAAMLAFGWTGFLASDDGYYAVAAESWVARGVSLGDTHWALRHTVVLPIAASFRLFGVGEYSLVLPTIVYFASLLALTYAGVRAALGRSAAVAAAVLLSTTPLFALHATIASADTAELFWVALSAWCLLRVRQDPAATSYAVLAGAAGGLALVTRDTSVALLAYVLILLVLDRRIPARPWRFAAAALCVVVAAEIAFLAAMSGDPFYKPRMSLGGLASAAPLRTGNVEVHPYVDPILALLLNQEFALLFFVAPPAVGWMCFAPSAPEPLRVLARFFGGLGLVWFVFVGYVAPLPLLPRYFNVPAYAAAILVAGWLARVVWLRSPRLAAFVGTTLVLFNLFGVYVDNRDHLFGVRALVRTASEVSETVYTDPETARAAGFLLARAGLSGRVVGEPPPSGVLYFHDPNGLLRFSPPAFDPAPYAPRDGWEPLLRTDPGRKLAGRIAQHLGADRVIPPSIFAKLDHPNLPVVLYRVGR